MPANDIPSSRGRCGFVQWGLLSLAAALSSCAVGPCDSSVVDHAYNMFHTWNVPTQPMHVAGPIYFVGTQGLSVFLIETREGDILLGGAKPEAAKSIEHSIRALGKDPRNIKILLCNHAHIDHAGTMAYFKRLTGGTVTVMAPDDKMLACGGAEGGYGLSGGRLAHYPEVGADRVLHDGDTVDLGEVHLKAYHTPGHTRGCATFTTTIRDSGKSYHVVFVDGTGVNVGTHFAGPHLSYPRIVEDYRQTFRVLKHLCPTPDIYLSYHSEDYNFQGKRKLAVSKGAEAWVDPECFKEFVSAREKTFEDQVAKDRRRAAQLSDSSPST